MKNLQWVPQLFKCLEFFHVNKSCKIELCGDKMHQIIKNMILSQGLERKQNLSASFILEMGRSI